MGGREWTFLYGWFRKGINFIYKSIAVSSQLYNLLSPSSLPPLSLSTASPTHDNRRQIETRDKNEILVSFIMIDKFS